MRDGPIIARHDSTSGPFPTHVTIKSRSAHRARHLCSHGGRECLAEKHGQYTGAAVEHRVPPIWNTAPQDGRIVT